MLAGDRIASKPINDENKAFLRLRGEPLFVHVVRALLDARSVKRIVIVGPESRLSDALKGYLSSSGKRIEIVEQGTNIIENAMMGYLAAIGIVPAPAGLVEDQFDELTDSESSDIPTLFLSCDIPLVTPYEIDEFLHNSDMAAYDYSIGLSAEKVIEPYYPRDGMPGIRMSYYHLAEGRCRHNNLHLGKLLKVGGMYDIERMYELRYQKRFLNKLKSVAFMFRAHINTFSALRRFLFLQLALGFARSGGRRYEWARRRNRLDSVTTFIGQALDLRMQAVFTRYGGAVLDIDNATDLETVEAMYDSWMKYQKSIFENLA